MIGLRGAGIVGLGTALPDRVMTNKDLERIVDTSDEWITTRTGIKERRVAAREVVTSDLAREAAEEALASAGVSPGEIDLIIVANVLPDMPFPSTSCFVQDKLGASRAAAFDVVAGCTGFVYALGIGAQFIASGTYDTVLVIGAEILSRILDYTDRTTCVLLGDGAGAVVLRPVEQRKGILAIDMGSDGGLAELLMMPGGGSLHPASHESVDARLHYFKMNGRETFKHATRHMADSLRAAAERASVNLSDLDLLVPHQANLRIISSLAERLEFPMDKVVVNIDRYGNMSAASVPVALAEAVGEGRVKPGDLVGMVAFGAGLTWASAIIRWTMG